MSLVAGAIGSKTILTDGAQVDHISENTNGHGVVVDHKLTVSGGFTNSQQNEIFVQGGNGHGSSATKIRRFTNAVINTGAAMTYADSSTNGMSITINTAGIYAIFYNDAGAGTSTVGISKNASSLTNSVQTLSNTERLVMIYPSAGLSYSLEASVTTYLAVNDVIRAHTDGVPDVTTAAQFRIIKIG